MEDSSARVRSFQGFLREGEWDKLADLSDADGSLWWQPNASGWTSVHCAASLFLPIERWQWVLQQQQQQQQGQPQQGQKPHKHQQQPSSSSTTSLLFEQRNNLGQSVWDVFLVTAVKPMGWQSLQVKTAAELLEQAMETILQNPQREAWLQEIRKILNNFSTQKVGCIRLDMLTGTRETIVQVPQTVASSVTVKCLRFLLCLQLLSRASGYHNNVMQALARAGGNCPTKCLAEFLWALFPYPRALHIWAATPQRLTHPWEQRHEEPWLRLALDRWPELLNEKEFVTGRTILQAAVVSGKSWPTLQCLLRSGSTCNATDPITGLALAPLRAASVRLDTDTALTRAIQEAAGPRGLMSGWTLRLAVRQQAAVQSAYKELVAEELSVVYSLLRRQPLVVTKNNGN